MEEDASGELNVGGVEKPVSARTLEPPIVVAVSDDMMQSIRLEDVIAGNGGRAVIVGASDALAAVDRNFPVLMLVDLGVSGDWAEVIRRIKLRPHTKQIPVYAYGSHVDTATLRLAREAGADHAWARSRMTEELVKLISTYVNPPIRYPEGWDDRLSEKAKAGIEEFNRGDYFEQHELLEEAWMDEFRPIRELYQGILQVGLAFYQIELGSWAGAMKMFGRGLPKLRGLPDVCQGVLLEEFRGQAEAIRNEIARLGPERLQEFDQSPFPKIRLEEEKQ